MTLLIMAAGNGSRYGALKQFDKLGPKNEYLFEFSIYDAIQNGFDHVVIITKKQFVKEIKIYLQKRLSNQIKLNVLSQSVEDLPQGVTDSFHREKPWGTAHAVWAARNYINESFVVLNADDYYGKGAFKKASDFIKANTSMNKFGLVSYHLKDTLSIFGDVSRGICEVENDQLNKISELIKIESVNHEIRDFATDTVLTGKEPVSMNFWICTPIIFDAIEKQFIEFLSNENNVKEGELYIPLVIQKMIDKKSIYKSAFRTKLS